MSRPNGVDMPPVDSQFIQSRKYTKQGGFLRVFQLPVWGATTRYGSPSSPLNTAASKLYYYVVHGNSRNISYDKSDLMKCYMAYDGVYMLLHEAIRAYSFIKAQDVQNRWVKEIVAGLGWDYDDLYRNMVKFRKVINVAITKINQIAIPDVFDIFKCHSELFTKVYCDRASGKPQFLANVSRGVWVYEDKLSAVYCATQIIGDRPTWSVNVNWNMHETLHSVGDFEGAITTMINAIYDSTDIGVIQGDLKRAFDQSQMLSMDPIPEDVEPALVYDAEYNLCIHNAEVLPGVRGVTINRNDPTMDGVKTLRALAVVRDRDEVDGNLISIIVTPDATGPEDFKLLKDSVHVMDLTDEWKEDADAVLLMQKYKYSHHAEIYKDDYDLVVPTLPAYYQSLHQRKGVSMVSSGPSIVTGFEYIYNIDAPITGDNADTIEIADQKFPKPRDITEISNIAKMFELAVTLLVYPQWDYNGSTEIGNPIWETENVTVYSDDVLWAIQNSMIESLWYNKLLYNI